MEPRKADTTVEHWIAEITAAKKREADYRKHGERILEIYEGKHKMPFNILYSNTETLMPALYSQQPVPVVQRRFKDEDPLGKAAALAGKRVLSFLLDTNLEEYDAFDDAMIAATLDAALPGRGNLAIQYHATMGQYEAESPDAEPTEYVRQETVCCDILTWNRVYYGYAKKWSKVPWVAYEIFIDRAEAERLFGRAVANRLVYTDVETNPNEDTKERDEAADKRGEKHTTRIYQIWDKDGGRQIRYLSEQLRDRFLKVEDDPLHLSGFFNCPRPLQFLRKTHSMTPTALYRLYEEQAEELNELTRRLRKLMIGLKVRGIYDSALGDELKKLLQADDNELTPADKSSSLAAEKGLDNAIWMFPNEKIVQVVRELYLAREQCKQTIYEITGISDIIRGATKASETLGAQEIKAQWGTMRVRNYQKEVQRFARDLLRMMLEVAATRFNEDTWAKMTGLPFLTTMQAQQLQLVMQTAMAQGVQPDPQMMAQLQQPVWGQVIQVLRDDLQRAYRIDIETNSTVEPEAADDHKALTELFTALSQVLNGLGPLVVQGSLPFEAAQSLLLFVARRFRYGEEIEDQIKMMKAPTPPDQQNGAEAVKQEKQLAQKELAMQQKEAEQAVKMKQMDADMAIKQKEMDLQMRELALQVEQDQLKMERQAAQQELTMKAQGEHQRLAYEQKSAQLQNTKFKTENVVNQKADQTLGKGVTAMQSMVKELAGLVLKQSQEHQQMMMALMKVLSAPRNKRAVRGKDGRIERIEEELVA